MCTHIATSICTASRATCNKPADSYRLYLSAIAGTHNKVEVDHIATLQVYFPVFLEGANLSMGDMHFSQGDGEVSFCGAIEMCAAFLTLK